MKAIAGCSTDDIPGVAGVGELTAAKYLTGKLSGKKEKDIIAFLKGPLRKTNGQLVALPYRGTRTCELEEDALSVNRWTELMGDLGMKSLRKTFPIARRVYHCGS